MVQLIALFALDRLSGYPPFSSFYLCIVNALLSFLQVLDQLLSMKGPKGKFLGVTFPLISAPDDSIVYAEPYRMLRCEEVAFMFCVDTPHLLVSMFSITALNCSL